MGLSVFGLVKSVLLGQGPLVGDLIRLDKEAQRDVATGIKYALLCLGAGFLALVLFLLAVLVRIVF